MKAIYTSIAALAAIAFAAPTFANNLTSLGVDANGQTAWRIESTATGPQTVTLRKAGGGSVDFIVNPGLTTFVIPNSTAGTYIAEFQAGTRDRVTKASGPQLFSNAPVNGVDGADGKDGRDGKDADTAALRSQMAADRALGALQTRTAAAGETTLSIGISGTVDEGIDGIAAGVRYGFDGTTDVYGVIAHGAGGSTSFGIGVTVVLGGGM